MTPTASPELYGDLVEVASNPGFANWLAMVRATGGCAQPVHLWGESQTIHASTGELLNRREPGRLLVACGNRRRTRCPSCSETYRADTFQLIKAGLIGGKNVPDTVAEHPKVFATFTAPSFGPVHQRLVGRDGQAKRCHPRRSVRCGQRHRADDPLIGQPLDPATYDYIGAVVWNALATKLWARTIQLANRQAARLLGVTQRDWPSTGRVSVAKVAEYQARGIVHFHAIFRLDGPEQSDVPPAGTSTAILDEAIRQATANACVEPPHSNGLVGLDPVVWGKQLDLRPISSNSAEDSVTDGQVAGYVAKYATKGAEVSGTIDRPLICRECRGRGTVTGQGVCERCGGDGMYSSVSRAPLTPHAQAMIETCWQLGGRAELAHLRLRPWAHMLGFRGHFATKTRRYSTTLGCLRGARQQWRNERTLHARKLEPGTPMKRIHVHDLDGFDSPEETVLVIGEWQYIGRGHSPGQAVFAASIREDLAESRRIWRHLRSEEEAA